MKCGQRKPAGDFLRTPLKKSSITYFLQFDAKLHETSDVSKFITVKKLIVPKLREAKSNYKHVTVAATCMWAV